MTLYAENINRNTYLDDDDVDVVNYVYLHGELEKLNRYDIVDQCIKDGNDLNSDNIRPVDVIFADGSKHDAILYIWNTPSHYEIHEHSNVPICTRYGRRVGLICAVDDKKANKDALEKFNSRTWCL